MKNTRSIVCRLQPRLLPAVMVVAFFFTATAIPLNAEIYKWVDADGNVQYTQTPPPDGVEADTIKPASGKDSAAAQQQLKETVEGFNKRYDERQKKQGEKQKLAAEQAKDKARCDNARKRQASFSRPRVNSVDENGQRVRLAEEKRLAELKKVNDFIAENCQ